MTDTPIQIWALQKAPEAVQKLFASAPKKWAIMVPATNAKDLTEAIRLMANLNVAQADFYGTHTAEAVVFRVFGSNA